MNNELTFQFNVSKGTVTISLMLLFILSHDLSLLLSYTKPQNFAQINWPYCDGKCDKYWVLIVFPSGRGWVFLFNIHW